MQQLTEGKPITAIAEQLGITVRAVRYHLTAALETESFYPNSLTPERIAELRQLEGEKLTYIWGKLHESFEKSGAKDGAIRARLAEASTRVSERLAKLFGLDMPLKIQEEQFRLSVVKTDNRVQIVWDPSILKGDGRPVPGLTIKAAPALLEAAAARRNGNGQIAGGTGGEGDERG